MSGLCLAILLWWSDPAEVGARLRDTDMVWIGVAVLAVTGATFSMAARWKATARAVGIELSYGVALREYYLAQLINLVLPGGIAGDVTRAVRARSEADLTRAAQSVMAERLLGQVALLGVMLAGFAGALAIPGGPEWGALAWAVVGCLCAAALLAWAMSRQATATGRFLHLVAGLMCRPDMLVHAAVTTLCLILGFYACARATGIVLPPGVWVTLVPLVLSAMLIPLSIGGWGWREGAAAALFPIAGAPATAGIATGITYGVVLLVAVLPAGVIWCVQSAGASLWVKGKPDVF